MSDNDEVQNESPERSTKGDENVSQIKDESEIKTTPQENIVNKVKKSEINWCIDEDTLRVTWDIVTEAKSVNDYICVCVLDPDAIELERVYVKDRGGEAEIMWLIDEPKQPYEDCEQLLCFRYHNGDSDECLAESSALPQKVKKEKKFLLKFKESTSRKRSGDNDISPFTYSNESFEMQSEVLPSKVEHVIETNREIGCLSETVNKCSISVLNDKCSDNVVKNQCDVSRESSKLNLGSKSSSTQSDISKRKNCPPPVDTTRCELVNNVKKSGMSSPGTEYYKIWSPKNPCKIMKFVYDVEGAAGPSEPEKSPVPPLPPRQSHKPLERTRAVSPPQVPRHRKPKKLNKPEDAFTFELIDTDEQFFTDQNITKSAFLHADINDFQPGEFYSGKQSAMPLAKQFPSEIIAPLATPETDGSLCESSTSAKRLNKNNPSKRSLEMPEVSPTKSKSFFMKNVDADNYITTTFTQKRVMSPSHDEPSTSSMRKLSPEEKIILNRGKSTFHDQTLNEVGDAKNETLKSHKPLTRQSSGRAQNSKSTPTMITAFLNSDIYSTAKPHLKTLTRNSSSNSSKSPSPVDETDCPGESAKAFYKTPFTGGHVHSSLPRHLLKHLGTEGTPVHSPNKISNGSFSKHPLDGSPLKPPAVARITAQSLAGSPQCPPTPTHHARKPKAAPPPEISNSPELSRRRISNTETPNNLDSFASGVTKELRTSEIRSPNLDLPLTNHFTIVHAGPPGDDSDLEVRRNMDNGNDSDSPATSPPVLRHMAGIRLPSIPERASREMALTGDFPPNIIGGIIECEEPLPPSWEARMDSHGRVFYIDHINRTTTWHRPAPNGQSSSRSPPPEVQRRQLDRRYQSIRRSMTSSHDESTSSPPPCTSREATSDNNRVLHPAAEFLTRPDFYSILHMNQEALEVYNCNSTLKHMISKIRRDASSFERYQHNRDLVALVNLFAESDKPLPLGWDSKMDRNGKRFFVDHMLRRTTFVDPRLPRALGPRASPRAPRRPAPDHQAPTPPPRPACTSDIPPTMTEFEVPVAYDDKVVAFLRQPNIMWILRERCGAACTTSLREQINSIRVSGTAALARLQNDLQLTCVLSLFEQEIMSYVPASPATGSTGCGVRSATGSPAASPAPARSTRTPASQRRDFDAKLRNFYRKLESKGYGQGPGKFKLHIRREHLLEDAFRRIMSASKKELQRGKLAVTWEGEEGLDYGGPSREFFYLLSRELFNPYYGLFEYSANDTYTVHVSPMSAFVDNHQEWFRFCGRVLGLALVHGYLVEAWFTRALYRALLRQPPALEDVEALDAQFAASLRWLQKAEKIADLELTFAVSERLADGTVLERELKPGGRDIPVTDRNKTEYLERVVRWRVRRGVGPQTEQVLRGWLDVLDPRLVAAFDARELELLLAGAPDLDVADWRAHTDYRGGYHDRHPVIQWFWQAIDRFTNEQRLRLVQFVTGTSSVPVEGFAALRGSAGPKRFCVERWGRPDSLPRAHTCFNRLDLPPYPDPHTLFDKLLLAVEETNTFAIE